MKTLRFLGCLALALALAPQAWAQAYPNKPIKFIVGYPPGGTTDTVARIVGQKLADRLGQPVVVENKPGANSIIAADLVKKAAPDGYTLLIGGSGVMVFNPGLYDKLSYDPVKDFMPITQFVNNPLVFAVNPSVPAKSLQELVALAKSQPGKLFYSWGATPFHVAAELLNSQTGANITQVPYKGSAQSITAAVSGEVPVVAVELPAAVAQLQSGKIRALALSGPKRSAVMPNIPTVTETGVANYELMMWTGLFAPLNTPQPIIDKLYNELAAILKDDATRRQLAGLGYETYASGIKPAEFGAMHKAEVEKWTKVSHDLKIKAE